MSLVKKNILANFAGGVWMGLMGLLFLPLYIRFLGIEAYGLIGIFTTIVALSSLLDMGLSVTLNREMARLAVQGDKAREMRDLVRTLEIPYWLVGVFISAVVIGASPFIAYHWVKAEHVPQRTVQTAVMIMGLAVAFQWPQSFYSGGLMGLQRQVLLNVINVVMATFRGLGAVLILWLVSPTIQAFFIWQIIVNLVNVGLVVIFLWRSLPTAAETPRFRRDLLVSIWRFAAGMTGITILATILSQMDKVILTRMLSLKMFGYYSLAGVVSMTIFRLVAPVFTATLPRLTNLVALGATEEVTRLYHKSAQLVSVLVIPAALVVALFSKEILLLWTRSPETAGQAHLLVSILVMGTAILSTVQIPNALQLASGWLRLSLIGNLISVSVLVPLMIVLTKWYGSVGAASVWLILNGGLILISVPIMHRRLLPTEKWRWYGVDLGVPFLAALSVAGAFRLITPVAASNGVLGLYIVLVSVTTLAITAVATPVTREWMQSRAVMWRARYANQS